MISLNSISRVKPVCSGSVTGFGSRTRALCASAIIGIVAVGCEGGSVGVFDAPMSTPVPALNDTTAGSSSDTATGSAIGAAGEPLLADESLLVDDESVGIGSELSTAPVVTPEQVTPEQPAEVDVIQSLDVAVVAALPRNVGLSAQAQTLLQGALSRGGLRIMPAGDSITHGIGGSGSYRPELSGLLKAAGCSFRMVGSQSQSLRDVGYYGAHEGYSGHTADNFLTGKQNASGNNEGIADAINYQSPDLVILHVGSVDLFKGDTVDSTIDDIAAIIDIIYQNKPDTVVVIANVIPWYNDTGDVNLPNSIRALGNKIQDLVQRSNNSLLSLADVRTGFTADMMQADLIHPNLEGDIHIANAIYDSFYSPSVCK